VVIGLQDGSDATIETLKAIEHPISKQAQILVEACPFAGTGNALRLEPSSAPLTRLGILGSCFPALTTYRRLPSSSLFHHVSLANGNGIPSITTRPIILSVGQLRVSP
jgi:hypothetical protein